MVAAAFVAKYDDVLFFLTNAVRWMGGWVVVWLIAAVFHITCRATLLPALAPLLRLHISPAAHSSHIAIAAVFHVTCCTLHNLEMGEECAAGEMDRRNSGASAERNVARQVTWKTAAINHTTTHPPIQLTAFVLKKTSSYFATNVAATTS